MGTMILGRSRSIVIRRFSSVKFCEPPTGIKSTSTLPDIQCFRRGDSIFDSAQIAEPDAVHRPSVRDIEFGRCSQIFRARLHSANQNSACPVDAAGHRASKNNRRTAHQIRVVRGIVFMRDQDNVCGNSGNFRMREG